MGAIVSIKCWVGQSGFFGSFGYGILWNLYISDMLVYLRQTFYCSFYSSFLGMSSKIDRVRLLFMLYFGATMYGISAMEKLDGGCFFSKPIKSKGYSLPFHSSKFHPNSRLHPFTHNSNSRLHYDSKLHPLQTSSLDFIQLHPFPPSHLIGPQLRPNFPSRICCSIQS